MSVHSVHNGKRGDEHRLSAPVSLFTNNAGKHPLRTIRLPRPSCQQQINSWLMRRLETSAEPFGYGLNTALEHRICLESRIDLAAGV